MKIILPVAGQGTRLRPQTHTTPKSLVRLADKTVLQYVIDSLRVCNASEYIFITDENGHLIQEFVQEKYPDIKASFILQEKKEGPAHAVGLAASRVSKNDDVLVVFNDTLFVTDLKKIDQLCDGVDGLIFSKTVEDYRRFGVNIVNDEIIVDMVEKPDKPVSNLAQVGLYYLKDGQLFMNYIEKAVKNDLRVKGEFYLPEVFKLMINDGLKLKAPTIEYWLDCGKPETLLASNAFLLEKLENNNPKIKDVVIIPPVFIDPDAEISKSVIGPNCSIDKNCKISNSIITNAIVSENSVIDKAVIDKSIIGKNALVEGRSSSMNVSDDSVLKIC